VLDAGHGGKDAGAVGVNGVKEKDINLGVTLALGRLIQKEMKDVKVVYTRKTDKFVELYRRGQIANENNGKLFISIHCNSTPHKPTNASGFEVYLLRPGRTKEAINIAERENSVIQYEDNPKRYEKLTDENFILVSMAHSAYMRYSERFSELVDRSYSAETAIPSRGVKQAGFYVLVGASMPSVLVETGFISNRHDAKYLSSSRGQRKIAQAIFSAIKSYKKFYESSLENE
jgi:N-acetylmuramoyl-L-alanine amidase